TLQAACSDAARALDAVWQQIQELREQDKGISANLDQLREQLQNDRGRLASLEALQEAAIGKTTKEAGEWLEHAPLSDRRSLAQRLVVEPGWERAVETVLGSYLQAVSVDSIAAVTESLTQLSEGGLALLEESDVPLGGTSEEVRWLADCVKAPAFARTLLAGVRVAESLQAAIEMRGELADAESLITPNGFWVGRNWLRINRSDNPEVGVIARSEEISRLKMQTGTCASRVEEVAKALADTRLRVEQLEEARK